MSTITDGRLAEWRREWRAATDLRSTDLDELAEHLRESAERHVAGGASEEEAIAKAIEALGPPLAVAAEYARAHPPSRWRDKGLSFLFDLRYAARQVRARPYFTAVAVGSVAVAIAANALAFSVVNGVLLQDPGYGESERLVEIYTGDIEDPRRQSVASWPISDDLSGFTDLFEGVVGYEPLFGRLVVDGNHVPVLGEIVDRGFFSVLAVPPAIGRVFTREDERTRAQVAVLAYRTWQDKYGGEPDVLGSRIEINGEALTVVGVAPEGFGGAIPALSGSVWIPRWVLPLGRPLGDQEVAPESDRERWLAQLKGRLAPGVSAADAQGALRQRLPDLTRSYPESYTDVAFRVIPTDDVSLSPALDGVAFSLAGGVMALVAMVLLIASMNLAGFLLARGADRWDELQLRYALGATRPRVVGQLFAEALMVAALGGLLGLGLCWIALDLLHGVDLPVPIPIDFDFSIDTSVLAFTVGISMAAAVLFGLIPGLQATRVDRSLGGAGTSALRVGRSGRLRRMLLAGQVAVSMVFLVLGGLFTRSLWAEAGENPGFRTAHAGVLTLELGSTDYGGEGLPDFLSRLRSEASSIRGITNVAFTTRVPMGSVTSLEEVTFPNGDPGAVETRSVEGFSVGPEYFEAMDVGILTGRGVLESDRKETAPVVIVSRSFVDQFGSLGARLGSHIELNGVPAEIVGVAEDVIVNRPREGAVPHVYLPLAQTGAFLLSVVGVAQTSGEALLGLRAAVEAVDPTVAVWGASTLEDHVAFKLLGPRVAAALLVGASSIALLLTVVGVIGSVTYSASRRQFEMAIRLSLGASARSVTQLVVSAMVRAIAIGSVLGLGVSLVGTALLRGLLYGVGPFDMPAYVLAVVILGGAAAVAAYLPARRVGRADLRSVLRDS